MLRHIGLHEYANTVEGAVKQVIAEKKVLTCDVGGTATTKEFTKAVIDKIQQSNK